MTHERSITLHQQDGGMSVQAFAVREGLTLLQAKGLAKRGKILGARQDARSKHWWIYPPAKLLAEPRRRAGVVSGAEQDAPRAAPPSGAGDMAAVSCSHAGAHPSQNVAGVSAPPAKPVLTLDATALPVAARTQEHGVPASCGKAFNAFDGSTSNVYTCAETQAVLRILREDAAKRLREGISYLRLEGREFSQLYAALGRERDRLRKLVGKGLVDVCNLRASDTVWQKMQAMCHEGRLL